MHCFQLMFVIRSFTIIFIKRKDSNINTCNTTALPSEHRYARGKTPKPQMWWPVRGWGTPPEREGKSPHHHPAPRKGGPNPPFFRYPSLRPPAGWLVARLLLSGDVERNPGPGKKWLCTLCSLQIKKKSQTSIRCNHTTTHWEHLTCTNITATQYTNTWKCDTHNSNPTSTLQK